MTQYLIPCTDDLVETIAKAIARERLLRESEYTINQMTGITLPEEVVETAVDDVFELLWAEKHPTDDVHKDRYRNDARIAIRTINLKIMTSLE